MKQHKSRNLPLTVGTVLLVGLVLVAVFGPSIAPHDPMQVYKSQRIGGVTFGGPPMRAIPPFFTMRFPLGVDFVSRDVLSRLLWAVRPTLLLCAMIAGLRIAVGVLVGLAAGWFGRRLIWLIEMLTVVSGAVPLLLVSIAVLLAWPGLTSLPAFLVALTLTGWINAATLVQNRIQTVLHAPFIESARAIGQRKWGIFWRHVLPQVWPALPVLLATELSAVTLLVAELGYLGFFVGGGFTYEDHFGDGAADVILKRTTSFPELGQMLSDFFGQYNRTPWVTLMAGLVVVIMLCAFTMLSEGLRRELDVTRPRTQRRWLWQRRHPKGPRGPAPRHSSEGSR